PGGLRAARGAVGRAAASGSTVAVPLVGLGPSGCRGSGTTTKGSAAGAGTASVAGAGKAPAAGSVFERGAGLATPEDGASEPGLDLDHPHTRAPASPAAHASAMATRPFG